MINTALMGYKKNILENKKINKNRNGNLRIVTKGLVGSN